ncbi:MAG: hypothetical protein QXT68_06285 [Halobacteria archaeon]
MRPLLPAQPPRPRPAPDAHREVHLALYRRRGPEAAANLRSLRHLRNTADYDLQAALGLREAARALELARAVRGTMEERGPAR